jgi:hypothetical protein
MTTIWELDFYSRPILDENKKKIWEVLICESPTGIDTPTDALFRYSQFCTSTQVNSITLKGAIEAAMQQQSLAADGQAASPPDKILFFRQAMNNMITKACDELEIPAQLSRRTYALSQWLQERQIRVYPAQPGFQPGTNPTVTFPTQPPQPLPAALMGEKWQFVSLPSSTLMEMKDWSIAFGTAFPLSLAELTPNTPIPGLLIVSTRAMPLAGWMSGLEVACVSFDRQPPRLLLETGINDRWTLASLSKSGLQAEATQFETAQQQANGVHFLAVQENPETEAFAGFWLLKAATLP